MRFLRTILLYLVIAGAATSSATPHFAHKPKKESGLIDSLVPRKAINTSIMGVNAFANDQRFGTVKNQLAEVKNTLKLKYIRVLFAWNDDVQPSPSVQPNFSFYDDIASHIPRGVEALVILTGLPSWMSNSANWINGDPRETFVRNWVEKVVLRYKSRSRIKAYQIWNEPNDESNPDNSTLEVMNSPENYVEMLSMAYDSVKTLTPKRKVVSAATTAIAQNFPETLDYNRALLNAGVENHLDIWGVHFYGSNYLDVILPDGIAPFLNTLSKPIWITESGQKGVNKQRAYVERTWPFLRQQVPKIARFYFYQFTESTPADSSYGLRTLTPGKSVSDLYIYLRDRR